ncbi:MAG TPA: hypothetical protein VK716_16980 [Terracidiphilus sp.]|jgi:hypothetical protein|nr:hypothetical protein [Terracidiphilus sp.]
MSTALVNSQPTSTRWQRTAKAPLRKDAVLSFTLSVRADRRRVFQVMTVAEYMETWFCVPGRLPDSPLRVASDLRSFRIEYFNGAREITTVTGNFQTLRRGKMTFAWNREGVPQIPGSLVMVRLYGDFERTTLCLMHSGLQAGEDFRWQRDFWEQSLDKLCSLF